MSIKTDKRFILIKASGSGFWSDLHHVLGQLLAAELTSRIPVVYWGENSRYSVTPDSNAFEQFFLPVSEYTIYDLMDESFTYFPPVWHCGNLFYNDPTKSSGEYRDPGSSMDTNATVLIHDVHVWIGEPARWIRQDHPCFGLTPHELYKLMLRKYIRLQPYIRDEIDEFYNSHMQGTPITAVHIRGNDKISEVHHLHELNKRYPGEIDKYLAVHPGARIFLMTDCGDILEEYKQMYGDILIHTDCKRALRYGKGVHYQDYADKRRKGIEVIKDTWLAARCDHFIGNGYSNVSWGIHELKDWNEDDVLLLK